MLTVHTRSVALSPVELLEQGAGLFRRTFGAEGWIYYLSTTPVALLTLWLVQRVLARRTTPTALLAGAVLWALAYCVRIAGTGIWSRRLLVALGVAGARRRRGEAARGLLEEIWGRGVCLWLGLISAPVAGPWVYSWAQMLPLAGTRENGGRGAERGRMRAALRLARGWAGTQWAMLLIAALFWVVLLVNFVLAALTLPTLVHSLLGVDNPLARSGMQSVLLDDPVFWTAMAMASYVAFDPIVKCAYAVAYARRCAANFGDDLRVRLHELQREAAEATWQPTALGAVPALSAERMRAALAAELRQPQYQWRQTVAGHKDPFTELVERLLHPFAVALHWLGHQLSRFIDWLLGHQAAVGQAAPAKHLNGWNWAGLGAAAVVIAVAGWLWWRARGRGRARAATPEIEAAETEALEIASASDREESEWFRLAQSLRTAGEYRAALRAAFLAGLAGLGERRLLTVSRDRTNREYLDELRRRSGRLGTVESEDLAGRLRAGIRIFDAVWYGGEAADAALVEQYLNAQRELLRHAG